MPNAWPIIFSRIIKDASKSPKAQPIALIKNPVNATISNAIFRFLYSDPILLFMINRAGNAHKKATEKLVKKTSIFVKYTDPIMTQSIITKYSKYRNFNFFSCS